jgi:hypothetical protein
LTRNKDDDSDGRASQAKKGNTKHAYVPGHPAKEMGNMQGNKKKGKETQRIGGKKGCSRQANNTNPGI